MSRPRAFTLLELLLAMALNLVLLAAIGTATFVFLRGFQRADRDVHEAQLARAVFGRLGQDLRELVEAPPDVSQETSASELQPTGELPPAVLRGSRSELQLLIHYDEPPAVPTTLETGVEESAQRPTAWQVDYALAQAAVDVIDESAPQAGLTRERRPWLGESEPNEAAATPVTGLVDAEGLAVRPSRDFLHVEPIADLRLRYYDGAEWREDWDSQLDGLPAAVEAVLLFERPARADSPLSAAVGDEGLALPPGGYRMVLALSRGAPAPEEELP